jgi:hypothetical protein
VSLRQRLAQSEERAEGLAQYCQVLEAAVRRVFVSAAKEVDRLSGMFAPLDPSGRKTKKVLADACVELAPLCWESEDIRVPEELIKSMAKRYGMAFVKKEQESAETGSSPGDAVGEV